MVGLDIANLQDEGGEPGVRKHATPIHQEFGRTTKAGQLQGRMVGLDIDSSRVAPQNPVCPRSMPSPFTKCSEEPPNRVKSKALGSGIPELVRFVTKLRPDLDAVRAALSTKWSQGQVEGQITKLKLIRRQMYGRGKFDLVRKRVLNAA
jgi:hypothetical protein